MYGLQITLPYQAALPGFFFREAARGVLAGVVRADGGGISALIPSVEPVFLET